MKIEVGKIYKDGFGNNVKIIYNCISGNFPIIGMILHEGVLINPAAYSESGACEHNSSASLISEWAEPLDFDWDCLPIWINKYIAKDASGTWYAYSQQPLKINKSDEGFHSNNATMVLWIDNNHHPKNFKGDWKESLFKNPKYND